jgi:DNA-directed RNA polymerase specialized sigma24 family protein
LSDIRDNEILEWYEQFQDSIFKYIYMMIQDYQSSEDLRHETFLKAYVHYDLLEGIPILKLGCLVSLITLRLTTYGNENH